jgi:hypothetical protein
MGNLLDRDLGQIGIAPSLRDAELDDLAVVGPHDPGVGQSVHDPFGEVVDVAQVLSGMIRHALPELTAGRQV